MGTTRRHFTDEFKREAVGLLTSSGRPLSQIARELGIALRQSLHRASLDGASDRLRPSMLRAWRETGDRGHAGSPRRSNTQAVIPHASPDLAAENARLRRENERLRMEREILKKTLRIFSEAPR
jgi:transposase